MYPFFSQWSYDILIINMSWPKLYPLQILMLRSGKILIISDSFPPGNYKYMKMRVSVPISHVFNLYRDTHDRTPKYWYHACFKRFTWYSFILVVTVSSSKERLNLILCFFKKKGGGVLPHCECVHYVYQKKPQQTNQKNPTTTHIPIKTPVYDAYDPILISMDIHTMLYFDPVRSVLIVFYGYMYLEDSKRLKLIYRVI